MTPPEYLTPFEYWSALLTVVVFSVGITVWTAGVFSVWIKSPSWRGTLFHMTLMGVALSGIVILLWVQALWQIIPPHWVEMALVACVNLGKSAISSPWFYILLGGAIVGLMYRSLKDSDPSEIQTVFDILIWIAAGGAVTLFGFAAVSNHKYVHQAQNTLWIAVRVQDAVGFVFTLAIYLAVVWYMLRRSIVLGILIGVLGGAGILFLDKWMPP